MGSIGYAYVLIRRQQVATAAKQGLGYFAMATSWVNMTLGLIMASQALPKLQVPVSSNLQVRCPFDFSDGKNGQAQGEIKGLERITRHPGLWSLAFVGLGNANLHHGPMRIWWTGPAFIALLGGSHTDSRFRRGMGGNLDPVYDSRTSNVPFAAILMGKQGSVHNSFVELLQDLKPLNAALAGLTATFWVASKGRIRV
jgi:prenyl protein peptidase